MKASVSAQCAIRALIEIAMLGDDGQLVPCSSIAADTGISRRFLSSILGKLKVYGILVSRSGPSGGYALARATSEISVLDVIEAVDGPLNLQRSRNSRDADSMKTCRPRRAIQKAEGGLPVVATLMNRSLGKRSHNRHESRGTAITQLAMAMREMLGRTTLDLLLKGSDPEANWQPRPLAFGSDRPAAGSVTLVG